MEENQKVSWERGGGQVGKSLRCPAKVAELVRTSRTWLSQMPEAHLDSLLRGATWHHLTSTLIPILQPIHPSPRITFPRYTWRAKEVAPGEGGQGGMRQH